MAATKLRKTHIGASDSVVAYMVKIDWTTAPVVKTHINRDFKLTMLKVSVIRGQYTILGSLQVTVKAGQDLTFVASDGMSGYYYMSSVSGCTCKAGRFHQECKHQDAVYAFFYRQQEREDARKQQAPLLIVEEEQNPRDFEQGNWIVPAGTVYRVTGPQDTQFVFADWLLNCWQCTCGGGGVPQCQHCDAVDRQLASAKAAA